MERVALGKTGLGVSRVGLGTVRFGRTEGLKLRGAEGMRLPSDAEVEAVLRAAAALGVNVLDTAPAYGASEERIGALMKQNGWFGGRGGWVVCTKAGEWFEDGTSRHDFSAGAIEKSVNESLKRLGVDAVDVLLLHSDGRDEWVVNESGAWEALEKVKQAGKARAIGLSGKSASGGLAAIDRGADVVMVTLNPRERAELEVVREAAARGVGVLVKKALMSGWAGAGRESGREEEKAVGARRGAAGEELDMRAGETAAQACVRWVVEVGRRGVGSVVVGTMSPGHLKEAVEAAERATWRGGE